MTLRVELLTPDREDAYEELLHSTESALLHASLNYRRFLNTVLADSRDCYLIASEDGRLVGVFPAFIKHNSKYGNVINSLPFYGSNGGAVVSQAVSDRESIQRGLLEAFLSLAREESVISSTLISNPLEPETELYENLTECTLRDERVGQFTPLPTNFQNTAQTEDTLMKGFHPKTRNSIRKAQTSELEISHSSSPEAMKALVAIHHENMEAINGPSKSLQVFEAIREIFVYDRDYRVYLAKKDGLVVAALLLFFYNRTVEYFTPATLEAYRIYQPMSLLIYGAMLEAVRCGYRYWNWGGPGPSQPGIYNFKKRWGAVDRPYFYYIKVFDDSVRDYSKETLLSEYPYFYVVPFRDLRSRNPTDQEVKR